MPEQMFDRTSRACAVVDLDPRLADALTARAEVEKLGDIAQASTDCVQTHSIPCQRTRRFGRGGGGGLRETLAACVLLPRQLLLAVIDVESGVVTAQSGQLADMIIEQELPRLEIDSGVSIYTRWSNGPEAASLHIALGGDQAGTAFKDRLREAVRAAKS